MSQLGFEFILGCAGHQDGNPAKGSGWGLTIDPKLTIWTALDDCTIENGALQIVPGSHHFPVNADGDQLSPEERPVHAPVAARRFVLLKRGEVIVLHNWMLHRSEVNRTAQPRRGLSVCYIDAATSLRSIAPEQRETKRLWPQVFPTFEPAWQDEVKGAEVRHISMLDSQQVGIQRKTSAKL